MKRLVSLLLAAALLAPAAARAEDDSGPSPPPTSSRAPELPASSPPPAAAATAPPYRSVAAPDQHYAPTEPSLYPGAVWLLGEAIPSQSVVFGSGAPSYGLSWQVTPILWSWGTNRQVSRFRFVVVDPVARFSGSIELFGTFDWFMGSVHDTLLRGGLRATIPLLARGESLAASLGTSIYDRVGTKVAFEGGLWTFSGFLGLTGTVAPEDDVVRAIATVHIRVLH